MHTSPTPTKALIGLLAAISACATPAPVGGSGTKPTQEVDDGGGDAGTDAADGVGSAGGADDVDGADGSDETDGTDSDAPPPAEDCASPGDEDGDGHADCADADCIADPACASPPEDCTRPGDEDRDGVADCDDADCASAPTCDPGPEDCTDGVDNDGDGAADCLDPHCWGAACSEHCAVDRVGDEDGDGLADCEDADCATICFERCDTLDGDRDGFAGCDDPDCGLMLACWGSVSVESAGLHLRQGMGVGYSSLVPAASATLTVMADHLRIDGTAHTASGAALHCAFELSSLDLYTRLAVYPSSGGGGPYVMAAQTVTVAPPADLRCPRFLDSDLHAKYAALPTGSSATWPLHPGEQLALFEVRQDGARSRWPSAVQIEISAADSVFGAVYTEGGSLRSRWMEQTFTGSLTVVGAD